MMDRRSLRFRVAGAFGLLAALLSLAWGLIAFIGIRLSEDRVLMRQLQIVTEDYALRLSSNEGEVLPDTSYIHVYGEVEELPPSLKDWAKKVPKDGYYEFLEDEFHVRVLSAGSPQKRFYVVFDVAGIEAASSEDVWLFGGIAAVVLLLTLLATGLGAVVGGRAIEPVMLLARMVGRISPERLSDDDRQQIKATHFHVDEVRLLAGTIEKMLQRICAFIERERYFTAAASHELRTPVTVISGAVELLEDSHLSAKDARAVARIKRATVDMRMTIEMFLSLSRATDDGLYGDHFAVRPLVQKAIDQQLYLLAKKNIEVNREFFANPELLGHPQAFATVVNNLVRNAFEHTPHGQGPVTVRVDRYEISVSNQGGLSALEWGHFSTADASRSEVHGLGLKIVERLCEYNGWTFVLHTNNGAIDARLSWSPQGLQTGDQALD